MPQRDINTVPAPKNDRRRQVFARRVIQVNFTLQTLEISVPANLLAMIPFVLAIVAMIVLASGKRARLLGAPAALGVPYSREQR